MTSSDGDALGGSGRLSGGSSGSSEGSSSGALKSAEIGGLCEGSWLLELVEARDFSPFVAFCTCWKLCELADVREALGSLLFPMLSGVAELLAFI